MRHPTLLPHSCNLCHPNNALISAADNHHVLVLGRAFLGSIYCDTVLLHLHGSSEAVNESNGLQVVVRMLNVIMEMENISKNREEVSTDNQLP